jgi:hypothetical protein
MFTVSSTGTDLRRRFLNHKNKYGDLYSGFTSWYFKSSVKDALTSMVRGGRSFHALFNMSRCYVLIRMPDSSRLVFLSRAGLVSRDGSRIWATLSMTYSLSPRVSVLLPLVYGQALYILNNF